jgi:hypothetical protein
LLPAIPAVANAIYDAVGVLVDEVRGSPSRARAVAARQKNAIEPPKRFFSS